MYTCTRIGLIDKTRVAQWRCLLLDMDLVTEPHPTPSHSRQASQARVPVSNLPRADRFCTLPLFDSIPVSGYSSFLRITNYEIHQYTVTCVFEIQGKTMVLLTSSQVSVAISTAISKSCNALQEHVSVLRQFIPVT